MRGVRTVTAALGLFLLPAWSFAGQTFEAAYGGSADDVARAVLETQNGNILLVGYSKSSGNGTWDGYLVEVTPRGKQVWQKFIDLGGDEYFADVLQLANGDLLLVGQAQAQGADNRDALLIRADSTGNLVWSKRIGGAEGDNAASLAACPDGNFVTVGSTRSFGHGDSDVWLIKFTADGDTLWTRTFGGTGHDEGRAVAVDGSGNIFISAMSHNPYSPDFYMLELAPNASTTWIRTYGTSGWDEGYGLTLLGDQAVFVGYRYVGAGRAHDMCAVSMKADGDTLWTGHYGTSLNEYAYGAATTHDGYLLLAGEQRVSGSSPKDAVAAKVDNSGHQVWLDLFSHDNSEIFYAAAETRSGYYLFVGFTNSFGNGGLDAYLVKTDANGVVTGVTSPSHQVVPAEFALRPNYPNPFNPETHIRYEVPKSCRVELVVLDVRGHLVRVLRQGTVSPGVYEAVWDGRDAQGQPVSSGVYVAQLRTGDRVVASRKMTLLK